MSVAFCFLATLIATAHASGASCDEDTHKTLLEKMQNGTTEEASALSKDLIDACKAGGWDMDMELLLGEGLDCFTLQSIVWCDSEIDNDQNLLSDYCSITCSGGGDGVCASVVDPTPEQLRANMLECAKRGQNMDMYTLSGGSADCGMLKIMYGCDHDLKNQTGSTGLVKDYCCNSCSSCGKTCLTGKLCPTPGDTITCGEVKAAYKANSCCGNPNGEFVMPGHRRLLTASSEEARLVEDVKAELQAVHKKFGGTRAKEFAQNILQTVQSSIEGRAQ